MLYQHIRPEPMVLATMCCINILDHMLYQHTRPELMVLATYVLYQHNRPELLVLAIYVLYQHIHTTIGSGHTSGNS